MAGYAALVTGREPQGQCSRKEAVKAESDGHIRAAVRAQIVELVHHGGQNRQGVWCHGPGEDLVGEEGHGVGEGARGEPEIDVVWFQAVDAVAATPHIVHIEVKGIKVMFIGHRVKVARIVALVFVAVVVEVIVVLGFAAVVVEVIVLGFVTGAVGDGLDVVVFCR